MSVIHNQRGKPVPNIKRYTSTGTGAIALSCAPLAKFRILSITAHGASSVANAITVTLNSKDGVTYDTLLNTNSNWTDYYKVGIMGETFEYGDAIDVACADAAIVKTCVVRLEIL